MRSLGRAIGPVVLIVLATAFGQARAQSIGDQSIGDVEQGLTLVRRACADCHAVERYRYISPHPDAPSFASIAPVRGMTSIALTVALRTSHETMPNIVLSDEELENVVAYLLSLK
jgi:mono/diheme cytochrome c family protein